PVLPRTAKRLAGRGAAPASTDPPVPCRGGGGVHRGVEPVPPATSRRDGARNPPGAGDRGIGPRVEPQHSYRGERRGCGRSRPCRAGRWAKNLSPLQIFALSTFFISGHLSAACRANAVTTRRFDRCRAVVTGE